MCPLFIRAEGLVRRRERRGSGWRRPACPRVHDREADSVPGLGRPAAVLPDHEPAHDWLQHTKMNSGQTFHAPQLTDLRGNCVLSPPSPPITRSRERAEHLVALEYAADLLVIRAVEPSFNRVTGRLPPGSRLICPSKDLSRRCQRPRSLAHCGSLLPYRATGQWPQFGSRLPASVFPSPAGRRLSPHMRMRRRCRTEERGWRILCETSVPNPLSIRLVFSPAA